MTAQPPLTLWLTGSELARVWMDGDVLRLRLSAALVTQAPAPGAIGGGIEGWSQGVELRMPAAELLRQDAPLMGRIAEARLGRGDQALQGLPLPGVVQGPLRLSLALAVGASLELMTPEIVICFTNRNNFRDTLAC